VKTPITAETQTRVPIHAIQPNPLQPRTLFQAEKLEELAASIRANGIIQPLIVRHRGDGYQIVAGERRWRAAQLAGLIEVPVVVQEVSDPKLLEIALIENIQREDLNALETAHAYDRLSREMGLSQEEIGKRTGKDRASIANTIRLLKLPMPVQQLIADQRISMGHARAILALTTADEQIELAQKAADQGMSVRQVEAAVQKMSSPSSHPKEERKQDPNVRAAGEALEHALATRVRIIEQNDKKGRIEIEYYSSDDLDRIYQRIVGE
jgi:ParB family chromosome partitioning protein